MKFNKKLSCKKKRWIWPKSCFENLRLESLCWESTHFFQEICCMVSEFKKREEPTRFCATPFFTQNLPNRNRLISWRIEKTKSFKRKFFFVAHMCQMTKRWTFFWSALFQENPIYFSHRGLHMYNMYCNKWLLHFIGFCHGGERFSWRDDRQWRWPRWPRCQSFEQKCRWETAGRWMATKRSNRCEDLHI